MRRAKTQTLRVFVFLLCASVCLAVESLPNRVPDAAFRKLIVDLSEPNGEFQSENLLSNETDYPHVMADLQRTAKTGGVYLGVGPEQNFNYIAVLKPKMAFIIDIRRQNLLEHLLYKAIFELSPDRASFISHLFSRKQPAALAPGLTAAELFDAYSEIPGDAKLFEQNLKKIEGLLFSQHGFALSAEDRRSFEGVYSTFREFGPQIDYNSRGGGPGGRFATPSYALLMTETDRSGKERSYLASEENYQTVRDLELRNLIVPLTGDFGGPKAIRAVADYLRDRGAVVSAFYTSNVEGYLFRGGDRQGNLNGGAARFYENVQTLPLDDASTFIRWIPGRGGFSIATSPIQETIGDFKVGRFTSADVNGSRGFGRLQLQQRRARAGVLSKWVARLRYFMFASWAAAAFAIRFFFWNPDDRRHRWLYSTLWAVGGVAVAFGLVRMFHL